MIGVGSVINPFLRSNRWVNITHPWWGIFSYVCEWFVMVNETKYEVYAPFERWIKQ